MIEITSKIIKTDVTCVKCLQNYIFAGIGGNLHIFEQNGTVLQIYNVFPAQRIYGIIPNKRNNIAVYGGNKIKILEFDFLHSKITQTLISKEFEDWILDLRWIDFDENIVTVFAHNYISLWSSIGLKLIQNVACEQSCLLYSASIVNETWDDLFVFSGTVFSEVLLWKPSESPFFCPVLCRLQGHDGVIFSINYNKKLNLIVTTSDDRTLRFWNPEGIFNNTITQLSPTKTLYGHLARVFKSLIIENRIISAGEDSNIHVWNLEGELLRKYDSHQNGCVWSLDCTQDERLVSGGGDSGVSIYPIDAGCQTHELAIGENEIPKILKILKSGNIVLITERGILKVYDKRKEGWNVIKEHEDLKTYAVMEISKCRKLLALGGFHGTIHIYEEQSDALIKICTTISKNSSRIFSIHWLTETTFLTSENDGIIQIWELIRGEECVLKPKDEFLLPPSKERWVTSAVFFNKDLIAVGDRKGNIHLFQFGMKEVLQSVKKAHSHLGITNLCLNKNELISMGRNGILKTYSHDSEKHLCQISSDKLPFMWLVKMCHQKNLNIILGYSGSNFIIWDHSNRRILHEINCGGGHRSWDFTTDDINTINFVYIKEKIIHRFFCDWTNIVTVNIVEGYHTKEINSLVLLKMSEHNLLMISGGEDTTIRLGTVDLRLKNCMFESVNILKSHLSSVRCVKAFLIDNNSYLIISAGGRAQIIIWNLKYEAQNDNFDIKCNETDSYYKNIEESESEIRIMDLTVISLENKYILITACSDGTLRCYKIDSFKLIYISTITYALKCIMKVEYIEICNRKVIISMATDGKLVFWDFTDFCKNLIPESNLKQFSTLLAHQSGINSFSYKNIKENIFLFATGGDDNAVILNVVDFDYTGESFNVKLISKYINTQAHGAQVTGIFIFDKYLVSTSIDQNVSIFEYESNNDDLKCKIVQQYSSVVADIQGMNCVNCENDMYVCLYGKGMEIIKIIFNR